MSDSHIGAELRRLVSSRASRRCEYCLIHEDDTYLGCQVDHVISEKHRGETAAENLAFACVFCNRYKGSDIATLDDERKLVPLFNPRAQKWNDHFAFATLQIVGKTALGTATARLLRFNDPERIEEREMQIHSVS
jgi:5-methylcytosine-specific restriction endonuclease McrA